MTAAEDRTVRIGGASGFWGDSSLGAPQLVASGRIDYLVFDYLAELTMSILAAARLKDPAAGYATDFVSVAMKAVLKDVVAQGIRVVSNAGGVNPQGCAAALARLADAQGVKLKIAVVLGDDVMHLLPGLRSAPSPVREMQSGRALPEQVLSANAYLGAWPIKAALDAGADVVITGRCVDSAVTLGVLAHEFGWHRSDFKALAGGSLAGHIIECGCQATGGLHTDWDTVPDWARIGYPIVECRSDGSFVCTKPDSTGGKVTPAVIAEQMLYEIGDPRSYVLPDVICDFSQVSMRQVGEHRVRVDNAQGRAPGDTYKVCATHADGFKTSAQLTIIGFDAVAKARRTAAALIERLAAMLDAAALGAFTQTRVEVLGAESCYGPRAIAGHTREAVLRITATHRRKDALELMAREVAAAGTSWAPGTTGFGGGRPTVSRSIRQFAFLLAKSSVAAAVLLDGETVALTGSDEPAASSTASGGPDPSDEPSDDSTPGLEFAADLIEVPLIRLAWARSGDKGDISNIGVIARKPAWLAAIRSQLTPRAVADFLAHLVEGRVTRFDLPGIHALNLVCEQALDGGGMASMRNDALGKGMAQILLSMPIRIPASMLDPEPS